MVDAHQVSKIRYHRQALVDNELKRDGRQEEDEGQLETILWQVSVDGERHERQTADEKLYEKRRSDY